MGVKFKNLKNLYWCIFKETNTDFNLFKLFIQYTIFSFEFYFLAPKNYPKFINDNQLEKIVWFKFLLMNFNQKLTVLAQNFDFNLGQLLRRLFK